MAPTSNSTSEHLPVIREQATMLLRRTTKEILLPNKLFMLIVFIIIVALIAVYFSARAVGRARGHIALLRRLESMDEDEILDEIRYLCWDSNVQLGMSPSSYRIGGVRGGPGFESGYDGDSDTEDSGDEAYEYEYEYEPDHGYESAVEDYVMEREGVVVDYLNTPD
ncbi:hypothetical protein BKA64DRAFT_699451 [Cadophora sp. MPI-SDFR-AT-0126]|nr:hypothetical protein BKA64DRAFT_699451 [Leotiomycetes sp. MPI-SDFR-AT-0126]